MIDLNKCKKGDILISKHGAILEYISPTDQDKPENYFDHKVKYLIVDGKYSDYKHGEGTRTNDGFVFKKNRLESDHDIISIIPKNEFFKILIKNSLKS